MNEENEIVMEVWKPIEGYPNYEVSNFGQVRNCRTGRILRPGHDRNDYLTVVLCQNGEQRTYRVHRLVGLAFIPNPAGLPQLNHINENPTDNRACNLEWCDAKYNVNFGTRNKRDSLSKSKPVEQYDLNGNYIRTWIGAREVERQTGIYNTGINACCNGKAKTAGGFVWKFAKKN